MFLIECEVPFNNLRAQSDGSKRNRSTSPHDQNIQPESECFLND